METPPISLLLIFFFCMAFSSVLTTSIPLSKSFASAPTISSSTIAISPPTMTLTNNCHYVASVECFPASGQNYIETGSTVDWKFDSGNKATDFTCVVVWDNPRNPYFNEWGPLSGWFCPFPKKLCNNCKWRIASDAKYEVYDEYKKQWIGGLYWENSNQAQAFCKG